MTETNIRRGTLISVVAALAGAAFLIPYKHASLLADARVVALAMLSSSAALSTIAAAFQLRGRWRMNRTSLNASAVLAALSISGNFCGAQALVTLDPGLMSVLLRMQAVFVLAGGALFLGEAITRALAIGAMLAIAGVVLMRWPFSGPSSVAGILWALGAMASFGTMVLVTRKVVHDIDPIAVNAVRLWLAVIVLSLFPGTLSRASEAPSVLWLYAVAAALCGPFISRLGMMYALRHITAGYMALLFLFAPVFAYALGYLFFGTLPTRNELLGSAVILVGIAVPVIAGLRAEASRGPAPGPEGG